MMSRLCEGGYGVPKSEKDALVWLKKSAAAGDREAMRRLAAVYENGTFGVTPDMTLARSLKKKAAVVKKAVFPDYVVM